MTAPLTLRIQYPNRRAVLASYKLDGATLSLFVPTEQPVPVGARVSLEVSFGDSRQTFRLAGRVTWRRAEARGVRLEPGLGIEFQGGEKYACAQMMAFCAGKPLELGTAGDPRVTARIPCRVDSRKMRIKADVRDISNSGAFIATPLAERLQPGSELTLTLEPGWFGLGGRALKAKVIWAGQNKGVAGFGARFLGAPSEIRPAVRKYVEQRRTGT